MKGIKKIRCSKCKYARLDLVASEHDWIAYECINPTSEYYTALLNIGIKGEKREKITWEGCTYGIPKKRGAM